MRRTGSRAAGGDTGSTRATRRTAHRGKPGALFEEIKAIHDCLKSRCLIYIDDVDKFDENGNGLKDKNFLGEDWSHLNLNSIKDYLSGRLQAWVKDKNQLIIQLAEIREG